MLKLKLQYFSHLMQRVDSLEKSLMLGGIGGRRRRGRQIAGWHHRLDGHEFESTPGLGDGQGGLACCDSWGCKELDTTEWLNWTELNDHLVYYYYYYYFHVSFYYESESDSIVSDSLRPHGLYSPWNSPGQNTGVGSLSLFQRIFPTQGSNSGFPHCRWILYQLSHKGSPPSTVTHFSLCWEHISNCLKSLFISSSNCHKCIILFHSFI